jgi:putative hydrolase of the HAD superfamily
VGFRPTWLQPDLVFQSKRHLQRRQGPNPTAVTALRTPRSGIGASGEIDREVKKILFFDAAGTLFRLPRGVGWHYRDVAERHDCSIDEALLNRSFREAWKETARQPVTGKARPDDDKGWWRMVVEGVLDRCQLAPQQLNREAYFEELYDEFTRPGIWELYPEVPEVLNKLSRHFRLGIISNFDGRLRPILGHLGLADTFDPVIISSEVGVDKPHELIFQTALTRSEFSPLEAMHIGDDPICDWQGATSAGLDVFRLDRPTNSLLDLADSLTIPSAS